MLSINDVEYILQCWDACSLFKSCLCHFRFQFIFFNENNMWCNMNKFFRILCESLMLHFSWVYENLACWGLDSVYIFRLTKERKHLWGFVKIFDGRWYSGCGGQCKDSTFRGLFFPFQAIVHMTGAFTVNVFSSHSQFDKYSLFLKITLCKSETVENNVCSW